MLLIFACMFLGALKIGAFYQNQPPPPVIVTPTQPTYTGNVFYLNSVGAAGTGDGSSAANAADASTAAKHDTIVTNHQNNWVLIYAPGTYLTTGGGIAPNWGCFQCATNFTLQGAGMGKTIIRLAPGTISSTTGANTAFGIFRNTNNASISNVNFYDFTLDMNANNQGFMSTGGASYGINMSLPTNCTIQRVEFIGFGSNNSESFPLYIVNSNSATGTAHNVLVDSCVFDKPATGNLGGLTCIQFTDLEPNSLVDTTCIVQNCQFLDLYYNITGFQYSQCVSCLIAQNNYARNTDSFWYVEPGSASSGNNVFFTGQTVQCINNTLVNVAPTFRVFMHPNGSFAGNMNIAGNVAWMSNVPGIFFGPSPPTGCQIDQYVTGTPNVGNITVSNNVFVLQPGYTGTPSALYIGQDGFQINTASVTATGNLMVYFPVGNNGMAVNISGTFTSSGNNRRP